MTTIPKIADPVNFATFSKACSILDVEVRAALHDPAWTLRLAASLPLEQGQELVNAACLPDHRPNLSEMREDVSALVVAVIWIQLVDRARSQHRARRTLPEAA